MVESKSRKETDRAAAVIVAAGAGTRLGASTPKLFVDLGGKPLVYHALSVFEGCSLIGSVVLVVPPETEAEVKTEIVDAWSFSKVDAVVPGGENRGESVYRGLMAIAGETGTVLVHDGARPFVSEEIIQRVIEAVNESGAAVPGIPSADTLKRVEGGVTVATLDRARIQQIQTPQGFLLQLIRQAYERAMDEDETATDDAALVERLGSSVRVVPGSPDNFKVTTPEGLRLARALLAARDETQP
jgi:2-C-methyl-D-erythritol 4-phosphate cytidylyltransferase